MTYELPHLPYEYDALEPFIDSATLKLHHQGHHQAYLDKLLAAIKRGKRPCLPILDLLSLAYKRVPIEKRIAGIIATTPEPERSGLIAAEIENDEIQKDILNNGGGYYNHTLYFMCMGAKNDGQKIKKDLYDRICADFGSMEKFKTEFEEKGMKLFGSGWVWLVYRDGKLEIVTTVNQDMPVFDNFKPILCCDVWEHAYYLKYKNLRKSYLQNWWSVVNWKTVGHIYDMAVSGKTVSFKNDGSFDFNN